MESAPRHDQTIAAGLLRRVARALGPADDDPSGIITYSMAGAQHGMALRGRRSAAAARGRFRRLALASADGGRPAGSNCSTCAADW